ncbi:MAG: hypothetical protein M1816_003906 [Peltula sp. TS41687]|nr:MAG: hypothetical protein M1816_003906 [Peltula sp. TS41687]
MMMNGRNACGRAVSLLNDEGLVVMVDVSTMALHDLSIPPTPELSRSQSWSSHRTTESPPPRTPADVSDPRPTRLDKSGPHVQPFPKSVEVESEPPRTYSTGSPDSETTEHGTSEESSVSTPPGSPMTVSTKPTPKRYPCPFADRLDCREMFTTSGHASRHAKKHTGEKNVPCPRCMKKFARKDNMKQHLKTHESGRGADRLVVMPPAEEAHRTVKAQKLCDRMRKRGGSPLLPIRTDLSPLQTMCETGVASTCSTDLSSTTTTTTTTTPSCSSRTSQSLVRPPLRRASATQSVPRRNTLLYTTSTSPTSDVISPFSVQFPAEFLRPSSTLLTPGLDALVIAADVHR